MDPAITGPRHLGLGNRPFSSNHPAITFNVGYNLKITGGAARSLALKTVRGGAVRPATDRMRQAVFSSLGEAIRGKRFLDLFAGSGAYGLEALSRGAVGGCFVEGDRAVLACLNSNLAAVIKCMGHVEPPCELNRANVFKWRPATPGSFDLVFIGPPYDIIESHSHLIFDLAGLCLHQGGESRVIFEMPGRLELEPAGWKLERRLGKGRHSPTVVFYSREILA